MGTENTYAAEGAAAFADWFTADERQPCPHNPYPPAFPQAHDWECGFEYASRAIACTH